MKRLKPFVLLKTESNCWQVKNYMAEQITDFFRRWEEMQKLLLTEKNFHFIIDPSIQGLVSGDHVWSSDTSEVICIL